MEILLETYVRNDQIQFYSEGSKLDTTMYNYGDKNWDLSFNLIQKSNKYIRVCGEGLSEFLSQEKNIESFTEFISRFTNYTQNPKKVHIDVDYEKLSNIHSPREVILHNPQKDVKYNITGWVPTLTQFERIWNRDLFKAFDNIHPNMCYPETERDFESALALNAMFCVIGSFHQLHRYRSYCSYTDNLAIQGEILSTVNHFAPLH